MVYYTEPVCTLHFERHCDDDDRFSLKDEFPAVRREDERRERERRSESAA